LDSRVACWTALTPPVLPAPQAPIIVTFRKPADPHFDFNRFYDGLRQRGYVIYPGKLTVADSFRIGCIGRLGEAEMRGALAAVGETLAEMGVRSGAPVHAEGMES
jgi:2-aminoethylphosphonate-pyruvate transaminase